MVDVFDIEKSKAQIRHLAPVTREQVEEVMLDCRRRLAAGPKHWPMLGDYGLGGVHLINARKRYVESFEGRAGVMVKLCEKILSGEIELGRK